MRFGRARYTLEAHPQAARRLLGDVRRRVEHRLGRVFPGDSVLDLACGDGLLAVHLAARNTRARVVALDPRVDRLETTWQNARNESPQVVDRFALLRAAPTRIPLSDEAVQAVVTGGAPATLGWEDGALEEVHRVLLPFGKLLVLTLEDGGPHDEGAAGPTVEALAEVGFGKVARETLERFHGGGSLVLLQGRKLDWDEAPEPGHEEL